MAVFKNVQMSILKVSMIDHSVYKYMVTLHHIYIYIDRDICTHMSARVCVCVFACLAVEPLTLVPYDCRHKPGLHGKPG